MALKRWRSSVPCARDSRPGASTSCPSRGERRASAPPGRPAGRPGPAGHPGRPDRRPDPRPGAGSDAGPRATVGPGRPGAGPCLRLPHHPFRSLRHRARNGSALGWSCVRQHWRRPERGGSARRPAPDPGALRRPRSHSAGAPGGGRPGPLRSGARRRVITVLKAPGFLTVQDLGWERGRAWGLPRSGAMDPVALQVANLLVGNPRGAAALEWTLGPGTLRFERAAAVALAGPEALVLLEEQPVQIHATLHLQAGQTLRVRQITARRFLYVAVRGGLAVPARVGSRSTYLPAQLGGLEGRRLRSGDLLTLGPSHDLP